MQEHALRSERATTIALDQHARSAALAALDLATGETRTGRIADCPTAEQIVDWARWATKPPGFACESGPCGFQLVCDRWGMGQSTMGITTRLLDVTANPLVALHFACYGNPDSLGEPVLLYKDEKQLRYPQSDEVSIVSNLATPDVSQKASVIGWL